MIEAMPDMPDDAPDEMPIPAPDAKSKHNTGAGAYRVTTS